LPLRNSSQESGKKASLFSVKLTLHLKAKAADFDPAQPVGIAIWRLRAATHLIPNDSCEWNTCMDSNVWQFVDRQTHLLSIRKDRTF